MRKIKLLLALLCAGACLYSVPCYATDQQSLPQWEYLLETPSWGMIEWSSATLPKGFWYSTFEFVYLSNSSYFANGKEKSYAGGRDSTSYMITASMLYGLSNQLTLGVFIPGVVGQKVDVGEYGQVEREKTGVVNLGDVELFLKYRILDRYYWALATELGTTLPTGKPYDKAGSGKAGSGDGQVDLNFNVKGDILLTEEAFIRLDTRFTYQAKREFTDSEGEKIDEKLGNVLSTEAGLVHNFKNVGLGGALRYTYWGATEQNSQVTLEQADLFEMTLLLSLGDITPRKHGKIDFYLDFPITGKNAPVIYRFGIRLKSIFQ
jgi:hypothetical protein